MYIRQTENWPNFTWDQTRIGLKLAKVILVQRLYSQFSTCIL